MSETAERVLEPHSVVRPDEKVGHWRIMRQGCEQVIAGAKRAWKARVLRDLLNEAYRQGYTHGRNDAAKDLAQSMTDQP